MSSERGGVCACFAPDTDEHYMQMQSARLIAGGFSLTSRWSATATDGAIDGAEGMALTLTYSFPSDGMLSVPSGAVGPGITSINNTMHATFDAQFGSRDAWKSLLRDIFDDWSAVSGVRFVEEPNDDGASWVNSPGVLGVRGDLRIVCYNQDGPNGVLGFNYFPNSGDMALDSSEFWADGGSDFRFLRNVVMHELGHGLGLLHVLPRDGSKLMEAMLALGFTGPQDDDIRAAATYYGDLNENNESAGAARFLGAFTVGESVRNLSLHDPNDEDWVYFAVTPGQVVGVEARPVGATYSIGPDPGTTSQVNTRAINPLRLELYDASGTALLRAGTAASAGQAALTHPVAVSDNRVLVRVRSAGSVNDVQRYELHLFTGSSGLHTLSLSANASDASIALSAADVFGTTTATPPASLQYGLNQTVTLTAPATASTLAFDRWVIDGVAQPAGSRSVTVVMSAPHSAEARYERRLLVNAGADRVLLLGESAALSAEVVNATPPVSFSWSPAAGLSDAGSAAPFASPQRTTVYTVTAVDALGESASDSVMISVIQPLRALAGDDRVAARGVPFTLTGAAEGGTPPYAFAWSPPAGSTHGVAGALTTVIAADTRFTLTVTDATGRTATDDVLVALAGPLVVNAGPDVELNGDAVVLTAEVHGGVPPYRYRWTPLGGDGATSAAYRVRPHAATTYTVEVTDSAAQTAADSVTVHPAAQSVSGPPAEPANEDAGDSADPPPLPAGGCGAGMFFIVPGLLLARLVPRCR